MKNRFKDDFHKDHDLTSEIEDKMIDLANVWDEITTSDLQGMAAVKAREIVNLVLDYYGH